MPIQKETKATVPYDHQKPDAYIPPLEHVAYLPPEEPFRPKVIDWENLSPRSKKFMAVGAIAFMSTILSGPAVGRGLERAGRSVTELVRPVLGDDQPPAEMPQQLKDYLKKNKR